MTGEDEAAATKHLTDVTIFNINKKNGNFYKRGFGP